eukprot:scaffold6362_cov378-Prasinococcus_capsulatus_cf.AAC.11
MERASLGPPSNAHSMQSQWSHLRSEPERTQGLFRGGWLWGKVDEHERLAVATCVPAPSRLNTLDVKGPKSMTTFAHPGMAVGECRKDIPQGAQRLVDRAGLLQRTQHISRPQLRSQIPSGLVLTPESGTSPTDLEAVSLGPRSPDTLRACEVHKHQATLQLLLRSCMPAMDTEQLVTHRAPPWPWGSRQLADLPVMYSRKSVWLRDEVAFILVASTARAAAARRTRFCASSAECTPSRVTPAGEVVKTAASAWAGTQRHHSAREVRSAGESPP